MSLENVVESWSSEMLKGYMKLAVLASISKRPLSGYGIMKEIAEETLGFWKPTCGGVYPILRELEEKGYIKGKWTFKGKRKMKIYEITDEGKKLLNLALEKQREISEVMAKLLHEYAYDVLKVKTPVAAELVKLFDFKSFKEILERQPMKKQIRILKKARKQLEGSIEFINNKLKELERKESANLN